MKRLAKIVLLFLLRAILWVVCKFAYYVTGLALTAFVITSSFVMASFMVVGVIWYLEK